MGTTKNIMPKEDLRKLQLIQLEMLLEVDRICRKYNIEYFLSSGTALGAVRHKGFIPWDDDLDVRMARKEYVKFCEACKKDLDTVRFFLQNDKTDSEYRWGYAKVRRKGTEYIRSGQEAIKCFSGVSIDIFIIDNVPDNFLLRIFHLWIRRACIKTLWSVIGVTEEPVQVKRALYHVLQHIDKKIPLGIIEWLATMCNKKETERLCCTAFYRNDHFKEDKKMSWGTTMAEFFREKVEIEFEGFLFYICKEYDLYLRHKYGNYWEYPPESKRFLHPPVSYCFDVNINLRGKNVEGYMQKEYLYLTEDEIKKAVNQGE